EAPDPHDPGVARLRAVLRAQRPERLRPAELLAALPEAAAGGGAPGRGGRPDRRPRFVRRGPAGDARRRHLDAPDALAVPRHVRPPRPDQGPPLRTNARHLGRPTAPPADRPGAAPKAEERGGPRRPPGRGRPPAPRGRRGAVPVGVRPPPRRRRAEGRGRAV